MISLAKTGKFIVSLRTERKLSQEQLGNIIGIGRDSISKWERGVSLPSYEMLLALSKEFNVSINEILYGERLSDENEKQINEVSVTLYNDANRNKKLIKILFIILLFSFSLFGLYYFINSYKSIKVYTISGQGKSVFIENGIFIKTRDKIYFSINEFDLDNKLKIKFLSVYYKDKENIIYSGDGTNILISDDYGANEYFDINSLKNITDNMYIFIEYDNGESETIKLDFTKDYINNKLFFYKKQLSAVKDNNESIDLVSDDLKYLIDSIKSSYLEKDDVYTQIKKDDNMEFSSVYISNIGTIKLIKSKDNEVIEDWSFDTLSKSLVYNLYNDSKIDYGFIYENDNLQCINGNCKDEESKISFFWSYLYESI